MSMCARCTRRLPTLITGETVTYDSRRSALSHIICEHLHPALTETVSHLDLLWAVDETQELSASCMTRAWRPWEILKEIRVAVNRDNDRLGQASLFSFITCWYLPHGMYRESFVDGLGQFPAVSLLNLRSSFAILRHIST